MVVQYETTGPEIIAVLVAATVATSTIDTSMPANIISTSAFTDDGIFTLRIYEGDLLGIKVSTKLGDEISGLVLRGCNGGKGGAVSGCGGVNVL